MIGKKSFNSCRFNKICSCSFNNCESLKHVTFESPSSLKSISKSAFYNYPLLEQITIPSSVNKIGIYAFGSCKSLTHFKISSFILLISRGTFNDCESLK